MTYLLIACSKSKRKFTNPQAAKKVYQGTITKQAIALAKLMKWEPLILSAKYGLISPDTPISFYNEKMRTYKGPWPIGNGYYVGGLTYFGLAPNRFQPLLPGCTQGHLMSKLKMLLAGKSLEVVRSSCQLGVKQKLYALAGEQEDRSKPAPKINVVNLIYQCLCTAPHTKEELLKIIRDALVVAGHPPSKADLKQKITTINCQLTQNRMGNKRGCTMKRNGDKFWIEQGLPTTTTTKTPKRKQKKSTGFGFK